MIRRAGAMLRRRYWPLRRWLSLVTALIAGGTLLVVGGLLLTQLDGSLQRQLGDHLRGQAEPVLERELGPPPSGPRKPGLIRPAVKPGKPDLAAGPERPADPAAERRLRELADVLIRDLAGRDTGVVVYDLHHRVVAASAPVDRREAWPVAPPDALYRAASGEETRRAIDQRMRRTLITLLPLLLPSGETIGVLQLATPLDLVDSLQREIGIALAVGTLLAVLIAGAIAAWVTRAALGPLDQMIRVTRRVSGGDLAARVDLDRQDEVGELAAAFDQMVGRLEAAFAMQRQLVSDAAHELRTPLNGLAGTLEIVQVALNRQEAESAQRLLASAEREIDRAGRLVNDLLTLSSLDERSSKPSSSVALAPVLRDVVRRARILAPDHEIVVRLDDGAAAIGDRDQLGRVFTNLLDNAVKYTPPGGRIDVTLARAGEQVSVCVRDTGRGIPPDDLPHIFDRFYRADRARSRQEGGAGLGLAIVQAIVQAHSGRVDAESTSEAGTTIRVTLPGVDLRQTG
jgi:heavy metal sensor kinase